MSQQLTICLFSNAWRSGAGRFLHALAQALAEADAKVLFVAPPAEPESYEAHNKNITRYITPRIKSVYFYWRRTISILRIFITIALLCRLRLKTNIYIMSNIGPIGFSLIFICIVRLIGGKLIFVVHDPTPHAWYFPEPFRFFERVLYHASYRIATHLVCLSENSCQTLTSEFNVSPSKTTAIPHGGFSLGSETAIPGTRTVLLFGSLRPNKMVLESMDAIATLRSRGIQVTLHIVGPSDVDPGYVMKCRERFAQNPDGILLDMRFVPEDELPSIIQCADALLLSYSDFNSQSGVVILAVENCRPVIATPSGGIANLFAQGLCGVQIKTPANAETIADAIEKFYERPIDAWTIDCRIARHALSEIFSWPRVGSAYINTLVKLTSPLCPPKV